MQAEMRWIVHSTTNVHSTENISSSCSVFSVQFTSYEDDRWWNGAQIYALTNRLCRLYTDKIEWSGRIVDSVPESWDIYCTFGSEWIHYNVRNRYFHAKAYFHCTTWTGVLGLVNNNIKNFPRDVKESIQISGQLIVHFSKLWVASQNAALGMHTSPLIKKNFIHYWKQETADFCLLWATSPGCVWDDPR